jgi:CRISPR/Cas system-associated protein endoribonuclease Cas2
MTEDTVSEESILLVSTEKLEKMIKKRSEEKKCQQNIQSQTEEGISIHILEHIEFQRNFALMRWLHGHKNVPIRSKTSFIPKIDEDVATIFDSQITRLD